MNTPNPDAYYDAELTRHEAEQAEYERKLEIKTDELYNDEETFGYFIDEEDGFKRLHSLFFGAMVAGLKGLKDFENNLEAATLNMVLSYQNYCKEMAKREL